MINYRKRKKKKINIYIFFLKDMHACVLCPDCPPFCCLGVAMATAVALLATAASMLYLNDI